MPPHNGRLTRPRAENEVKQAVKNSHVVDAKQGMVAHEQERSRVNRDVIQACRGRKAQISDLERTLQENISWEKQSTLKSIYLTHQRGSKQ
jgi:hypothetical protein